MRIVRLSTDGEPRVRVLPGEYDPDVRDSAAVHAVLLVSGAARDYQEG